MTKTTTNSKAAFNGIDIERHVEPPKDARWTSLPPKGLVRSPTLLVFQYQLKDQYWNFGTEPKSPLALETFNVSRAPQSFLNMAPGLCQRILRRLDLCLPGLLWNLLSGSFSRFRQIRLGGGRMLRWDFLRHMFLPFCSLGALSTFLFVLDGRGRIHGCLFTFGSGRCALSPHSLGFALTGLCCREVNIHPRGHGWSLGRFGNIRLVLK